MSASRRSQNHGALPRLSENSRVTGSDPFQRKMGFTRKLPNAVKHGKDVLTKRHNEERETKPSNHPIC